MPIAVLGAGVVGMTTAYYLAEAGHDVIVFDRAESVAAATSHANGAQLSYSYTDSLAQPGFMSRIPGLVMGFDPAIRVGRFGNEAMVPWGLSFMKQCTTERAKANTLAVLDIALESSRLLDEIRATLDIDFAWRRPGKLAILSDAAEVESAREKARWKQERGCDVRVIDYEEALSLEPALADMKQDFAGAVYSPDDEVGDARAFSVGLADYLVANRGVELRLGESVEELLLEKGKLHAVRTASGEIEADAVVVCLGPWTAPFLRPLGIPLPIYPIRGYSITLPAAESAPSVSITNIGKRIVYSLLEGQVRIAGFADFLNLNTGRDKQRLQTLKRIAREVAPKAADYEAPEQFERGGFRPVTPDSRPIVGRTNTPGVYLNCGHGVLGWTLSCATGKQVADELVSSS